LQSGILVVPKVDSKVGPEERLDWVYLSDAELAGRKKIEKTVRLEVTIGEDGQVHDMTVVKFSGYDLDEQSVRAVNQWNSSQP
jgi:TonB family protein